MASYMCPDHPEPIPAEYYIFQDKPKDVGQRGYACCSQHLQIAIDYLLWNANDVAVIIKKVCNGNK